MRVQIVKAGYHPLRDALVAHLAIRSPRVVGSDLLEYNEHDEARGTSFGDVDAFVYLPPYYMFREVGQIDCVYPTNLVGVLPMKMLAAARRQLAKVIMISGPEAIVAHTARSMPTHDTQYGRALWVAEAIVRGYERGMVIRIPVLDTDPWIISMAGRTSQLMPKEPDVLFSLGSADEVAKIVGDAIESAWYGLHQVGGPTQTLRLSNLIGSKDVISSTYNYSLPAAGLTPVLMTDAKRVWERIRT